MENAKYILVRYGELGTKGKNRNNFIRTLSSNIHNCLRKFNLKIITTHDHIYINITVVEDYSEIIELLKDISGIRSFSIVYKVSEDLEELSGFCRDFCKTKDGKTFKIECRRIDKSYPYRSMEVINKVAGKILSSTDLKVDVHNPDITLNIQIKQDGIFVFFDTILGAGGYPLGTGGKALMMLSGGIDSPVAAYLMMKRGIQLEFIHFASPPYTQDAVIDKLKDICHELNKFQPLIKLHIVPFTKIQEEIYKNTNESYCITIMRRRMYEIASKYAEQNHLLAICNGESIGQVASQTLNSMDVIDPMSTLPVIRPLAVMDKLEIINLAQKINTYEISIRPFEDCCTIFKPKNPKTMPKLEEVLIYESKVDYAKLVDDAVYGIETIKIEEEKFEI